MSGSQEWILSQKWKVSFRWGRGHLLIHSFLLSRIHLLSISYLLLPSICSEYFVSYSVLGTKDTDIRDPSSVLKEFTLWRGSRGTWVLERDQTGTQPRLDPSLGACLATTSQPGCCENQRRSCWQSPSHSAWDIRKHNKQLSFFLLSFSSSLQRRPLS